jgi:multimeric flavodoxin WrbA
MRITILNGNPDASNEAFDCYIADLTSALQADQHQVTAFELRDLDIRYCNGCFGCWVKTPGECGVADASRDVCRAAIHSDLLVFASPLVMGFVSALLKKMMDKLIPLVHPYIVVDQQEAHHLARYDSYPLVGLVLEKGTGADDEDIAITSEILSRTALNLKSRLAFTRLTQDPVAEVAHAANSL